MLIQAPVSPAQFMTGFQALMQDCGVLTIPTGLVNTLAFTGDKSLPWIDMDGPQPTVLFSASRDALRPPDLLLDTPFFLGAMPEKLAPYLDTAQENSTLMTPTALAARQTAKGPPTLAADE